MQVRAGVKVRDSGLQVRVGVKARVRDTVSGGGCNVLSAGRSA